MSYNARAVANFFLEKAKAESLRLDPMKLQKLVFFAHGWHLALTGRPLINETVEAWRFGPVIRSLYSAFREFGSKPITELAADVKLQGGRFTWTHPQIPISDTDTIALLSKVWDVYKGYTGIQLSNATHSPNTPWTLTVAEHNGNPPKGLDIPPERIKAYFEGLAKGTHARAG